MRARNSSVVRSGSRTNTETRHCCWLQVAPYWGEECISTDTETNLCAAADLIAAARALTGGRRQHRGC